MLLLTRIAVGYALGTARVSWPELDQESSSGMYRRISSLRLTPSLTPPTKYRVLLYVTLSDPDSMWGRSFPNVEASRRTLYFSTLWYGSLLEPAMMTSRFPRPSCIDEVLREYEQDMFK